MKGIFREEVKDVGLEVYWLPKRAMEMSVVEKWDKMAEPEE